MASLNEVLLIGNLTHDVELKQTTSGKSFCNFSIGVNRPYVKDQNSQDVDFVNIVAWEKQAEFVGAYFSKGEPIFIRGRLQVRPWTDTNGDKRYSTEVVAEELAFVRSKQQNSPEANKENFQQ